MSYDLQVWSVYAATRKALGDNLRWNDAPSGWVHSAHDWQIVVSHSGRVTEEDIPNAVKSLLPGIEHLTEINVEGRFPEAAKQLAIATGSSLARDCYGALVDPQEGTQWAPSGVKRLKATKSSRPLSTLYLSWWFMEGPLLSRSGRQEFLEVLQTELPEALPKRYGLWEPPQYVFAQTGREHLLEFLDERLPSGLPIVWYPHRPVIYLHLGLPKTAGGSPKGFRSNYLQVEIDSEVLKQPGWETQLRRLWLSLNRLIQPFYSEARTLPGGVEKHPVRGWWWRGIPTQPGHAMAIGEAYQELWPDFVAAAYVEQGLAFVSTASWAKDAVLTGSAGHVPSGIRARPFVWPEGMPSINAPVNTPDSYPEQWPFEAPFRQRDSG